VDADQFLRLSSKRL